MAEVAVKDFSPASELSAELNIMKYSILPLGPATVARLHTLPANNAFATWAKTRERPDNETIDFPERTFMLATIP